MNPFGCLFGILIAILAFVFIAALNMAKKVKDTISSAFSPRKTQRQSAGNAYDDPRNATHSDASSSRTSSRRHKKIFEDNEGEYVDFEEIK